MTALTATVSRAKRPHARRLLVRLDHAVLDFAIGIVLAAVERVMRRRV